MQETDNKSDTQLKVCVGCSEPETKPVKSTLGTDRYLRLGDIS